MKIATIFHHALAGLGGILLTIGSFFVPAPQHITLPTPNISATSTSQDSLTGSLGASIPKVYALFTTSLQSQISAVDTSMTLVAGSDGAGNVLAGYICFTIDEGSVSAEFVCGTASSTSVTSMIRGVDFLNGSLAVGALAHTHRRGASVKITNYPVDGIMARILSGTDSIPASIYYDSSVTAASLNSNPQNLASVAFVASTSYAGVVDATTQMSGKVQLSTKAQLITGTATDTDATAFLVPANSYFNSTSSATTTVPVTGSDGKISSGFIATSSNYRWTGNQTFTGTTTLSGPLTQTASSTFATTTFTAIPTAPTTTPTSANQLVTKNYLGLFAGGVDSFTYGSHNTNSSSTGVTFTVDGTQKVIISYGGSCYMASDSQAHTDTPEIVLDNATLISYTAWSTQATAPAGFGAGISYSTTPASGSHTIKYRFTDSTSGTTGVNCSVVGYIATIKVTQ